MSVVSRCSLFVVRCSLSFFVCCPVLIAYCLLCDVRCCVLLAGFLVV